MLSIPETDHRRLVACQNLGAPCGFQLLELLFVGVIAAKESRSRIARRICVAHVLQKLLRAIGQWTGWMNGGRWEEIFWLIALLPAIGIAVWYVLSWKDGSPARA